MAMTDTELLAVLSRLRGQMLNAEGGELSQNRQDNLDRYLGEPYGNELDGDSKYITREVMEAVEWALPSLLRIFTSGDRVVEYEPVGPDDEELAAQETDVVNHILLKENNGFMTFYQWFKDALMYQNGYAKIYTEEVETVKTERYSGITEQGLVFLSENEGYEIVAVTPEERMVQSPQGMMPVTVYEAECRVTKKCKKLKFEAVPGDQVLTDSDLSSLSMDEARAVCHRTKRSKSWLIQAGYDQDILDLASSSDDDDWGSERVNRFDGQDVFSDDDEADESMKMYWLEEWYVFVDYDSDGIAERRKVDVIGGKVFDNIEYDYQPIVALSSIPMSHRHSGLSLVDLVKPIQELATYLQRAINDNIARINKPKKYLSEGGITSDGKTIEQLLDDSEIVTVRQPGMIEPEQHQPVLNEILAVRQTVIEQTQIRTGVAPNLSLNADVLQQSTADAFGSALNKANERIETIARIFAETGIRDAMLKAHRQIKEHQDIPKTVKIHGKWVESNPADWKERENVTVNVGLGFAGKDQQLASAKMMLDVQTGMIERQMNFSTPENIFNALEDLVEAAGRKAPERYFTIPEPPPPPEPDPLVMAQVEALKAQVMALMSESQRKDFEAQLKAQQVEAERALKQAQAYKTMEEGKKVDLEIEGEVQGLRYAEHSLAVLNNINQQVQASTQREQQASQTMQALQQAAEMQSKPKRVVRDENGNIIGTEVIN